MGGTKKRKVESESDTEDSDSDYDDDVELMEVDGQMKAECFIQKDTPSLSFDDMGGMDDVKQSLYCSVVGPMVCKDLKHNNEVPKGILFYGPPGTGKTKMALCLIAEINRNLTGKNVTFFSLQAGDIKSKYFGESEKMIGKLFKSAVENQPSVIFFDEIDALACSRDTREEANAGVVSCILAAFNSFEPGQVLIIGTTNLFNRIDPALLRPGRISKKFQFLPPTEKGRVEIISQVVKKWKQDVPNNQLIHKLAKLSCGFTGADIQDLCSSAVETAQLRVTGKKDKGKSLLTELKNVIVTDEDWMVTLKSIQPTYVNCLGGYNFQWKGLLDINLPPLLEATKTRIVELILPERVKCFMFWAKYGLRDINTHILPYALESLRNDFSIFIAESIAVYNQEKTIFMMFIEIVRAVLESKKKSILVIKQIDKYWKELTKQQKNYISEELEQLQNRNIKILTTSSVHINDCKCPILQELFKVEDCSEVDKISDESIKKYFEDLWTQGVEKLSDTVEGQSASLASKKKRDRNGKVKKQSDAEKQRVILLEEQFERLHEITEEFSIQQFTTLHTTMTNIITNTEYTNPDVLIKNIREHLDFLENIICD